MLTLRYNPSTERYDCYKDKHIVHTLACGSRVNLYCDGKNIFVAGRIEHQNINSYYCIGDEEITLVYLYEGLQGTLN